VISRQSAHLLIDARPDQAGAVLLDHSALLTAHYGGITFGDV
jgi:hypothetical protein